MGTKDTERKRPEKVILSSEVLRDSVLNNLSNLEGKDRYKGISITADYTINERKLIKLKVGEAKALNAIEPGGDAK